MSAAKTSHGTTISIFSRDSGDLWECDIDQTRGEYFEATFYKDGEIVGVPGFKFNTHTNLASLVFDFFKAFSRGGVDPKFAGHIPWWYSDASLKQKEDGSMKWLT